MTDTSSHAATPATYFAAVSNLRSRDSAARVQASGALLDMAFGPECALQRRAAATLEDAWPRLGLLLSREDGSPLSSPSCGAAAAWTASA